MKKFIAFFFFFLLIAAPAKAGYYDNFKFAAKENIKPFARDLGSLLGTGTANTARSLGFSGFDLGLHAGAMLKPSKENAVLDKDKAIGLGLVQLEIGMPYRIDGFIRGNEYEGIAAVGGGLRYGLWNVSDENYKVNAAIVGMCNMVSAKSFYAVHWNATLVLSMNLPVLSPYISGGVDSTYLVAQAMEDASLSDSSVRTAMPRYAAGLRAKFGLLYLSGEAAYTHGEMVLGAGAGVRF
ncbi:MAG: hypothetical protein K5838_08650 [Elusimicrobiales bacterium]|nr:hypothetical protein [Elusimicrobiales bacterium]